jgi:hypothetical protein
MMKKLLLLSAFTILTCVELFAQGCPVLNINACTQNAPTVISNTISCTPPGNNRGRRNFRVNNMIAGATYTISNCGSGFDTQITISDLGGTVVGFADDDGPSCAGLSASINFVPPATGDYRIQLNRWNCQAGNNMNMLLNGDINVTYTAAPYDPCATITNIASCGTNTTTTFTAGTGAVAGECTFLADGQENVYTFTPPVTGNYSIDQSSSTDWVDYYYKPVSAGCGSTGWTCTGAELNGAATGGSFPLTGGTQYYIMVDPEFTTGGSAVFNIVCPVTGCTGNPTTDIPGQLYISTVSFLGTLEDTSNTSTFSTGYEDWTGLTPIARQVEGEGINIFVENNDLARIKAWVDWDNDGSFDNATELVYDTANITVFTTTFGFVIPFGTTPPGDYRIRIRNYYYFDYFNGFFGTDYDYNACEDFVYDGLFLEDFGEAEDYLFTVEPYCDAIITSITDGDTCGPGSVTLNATATGLPSITEYRWYANETGGSPLATTATGTWNTPSISTTTIYWVAAYNGTCESWVRTPIEAQFNPIPTLTVTPDITSRVVCGENDALEITATGDIDDIYIFNEDFETGNLGLFSNINIIDNGVGINTISDWQNRTSTYVPDAEVWYPAISSGFGPNQFVMSNSDVGPFFVENALQTTSSYDTSEFTNLTLSLRSYYSHYLADGVGGANDYVAIEVSTDGTTWINVTPNIIADIGIGTKFETRTYNLDTYIDEPTLSIRIRYYAFWSDGVAIDDVKLFGDKDITAVDWSTTPAGIIDLYVDTDNDNIGDTPYTTGAYSTVYAIPSISQLEDASYSFTINASLANNCGAATLPFDVTNNTRVWTGSTNSSWNLASNWLPSQIPTSDNCVIIKNVTTDSQLLGPPLPPGPAYARNLTVKNGGYLELEPFTNLTVTDWINVEPTGTFDVRSSANLVQITNVATNNNTGSINMQREVTGLTNFDYVYWSSAVENFGVLGVSPSSNPGLVLEWLPTVGGNGAGNYGEWQATSENMIPGKGYAIRELTGTAIANTAEFIGRPSNGIIDYAIESGGYTGGDYAGPGNTDATANDDNWNLVGNPYPSSIEADRFITVNAANIMNDSNPAIAGTVYIWSHASAPSAIDDPFYGDYVYNYNANDYIAYNLTGPAQPGFDGFISAGQGFFVLMDNPTASYLSVDLRFDNTMRNGIFRNDQFFRTDNSSENQQVDETTVLEKNRIWLDLIDNNDKATPILVGYISGATNMKDRLYDGEQLAGSSPTIFFSLIDDEKMAIQGRSLPFDANDVIPLGLQVPQNGDYAIAINHVDGLFETTNQDIFLEDTYTNTIHDLRLSPYTFTSESGLFNDRFILKYNEDTLSVNTPESTNQLTILAPDGKYVKITSTQSPIKRVMIYDVLGRVVMDQQEDLNNSSDLIVETKHLSNESYIVKATLHNGIEKTQKVILRQ